MTNDKVEAVFNHYNRKHEEVCDYCGKPEHYALGLCRNCYSRFHRKGTEAFRISKYVGTTQNNWLCIENINGKSTFICAKCGTKHTKNSSANYKDWPKEHMCMELVAKTPMETTVMEMFVESNYGLNRSMADIARELGVCRERVSQIIKRCAKRAGDANNNEKAKIA